MHEQETAMPGDCTRLQFSVRTLLIAVALLALVIKTEGFGLIGLHYPRWIDNEPLSNPVKVERVSKEGLHLADGRVIAIRLSSEVTAAIKDSQNMVELQPEAHLGGVLIYVKQPMTRCGTPWARGLVNLRWFPDDIPAYYKSPLDLGTIVQREQKAVSESAHR